MLINFSNHPASTWSAEQLQVAQELYGDVMDLPFPNVNSYADENEVAELADLCSEQIVALAEGKANTVHAMGEMSLTFAVIRRLEKLGIPCVESTTERIVKNLGDGHKDVLFRFARFRKYE